MFIYDYPCLEGETCIQLYVKYHVKCHISVPYWRRLWYEWSNFVVNFKGHVIVPHLFVKVIHPYSIPILIV